MNRCEAVCPKYSKPSTKGGNYNYNYKEYTTHYKREKGCLVCGITNSCILDFHHIDPSVKSFTLGKVIKPSLEILKEEISKCVVLCSNHHRLHHYDTTFDLKPYINEWLLNNKGGSHA